MASEAPARETADLYWPKKFTEGQCLDRKAHNRAYVDELRDVWKNFDEDLEDADTESDDSDDGVSVEDGEELQGEQLWEEDHSLPRVFMEGRSHLGGIKILETNYDQAKTIERFFPDVSIQGLEGLLAPGKLTSLALLHEQSKMGKIRHNIGTMDAGQLYRALLAEVGFSFQGF